MRRRTLISGFGSLVASSVLAIGSGAFTTVSAERAVRVETADDDRAFLRLEPITDQGIDQDATGRSKSFGDTIKFDIPGTGEGENQNAEGLGVDSVYEFHDLFSVTNQGTQPVELYSTYDGSDLADLALVNDGGVLRDDPPTLTVGKSIDVGLYIDTHGSSIGEFNETLTIVADQPDD
jgi:hypothetical protein